MIRIVVDSSSDMFAGDNISVVPMQVQIDGKDYFDGVDLTRDSFYDILTNTSSFPKTSQPSPQALVDIFEDVKAKGDSCIAIMLSGGLSGTYQSAVLAKQIVDYDKIYVIDSKSTTYGVKILVDYVLTLEKEGKTVEEIVEKVEKIKRRITIYAGLDTLEYLSRGGRLSKAAELIGSMVNIKPIITLDEEGKIQVPTKCLGIVKAIRYIVDKVVKDEIDTNHGFYTLYTSGTDNTEKLEKKLEKEGIAVAGRAQVGPTIGSHVGPEAYGVVFVRKKKLEVKFFE